MERSEPCGCEESVRLRAELEMARIDERNAQDQFAECNQEKALALEDCDRLRTELETARQELANGIEVMNARQDHARAEIAQLKAELASMMALLEQRH